MIKKEKERTRRNEIHLYHKIYCETLWQDMFRPPWSISCYCIYNIRNLINSRLSCGHCRMYILYLFSFSLSFHFSKQKKILRCFSFRTFRKKASHVIENMFILANVSCSICYTAAFQFNPNADAVDVFFSWCLTHHQYMAFAYSFALTFIRSLIRLPISFDRMVSYKMGAHYMCTVYLVLSPCKYNNNNNNKCGIT